MSKRYNNGSHYEKHPRADELHEGAAHAHRVGEQHGMQEHLTGHEHSRQQIEQSLEPHQHGGASAPSGHSVGHGVASFGHQEIAALAHQLWQARGCPTGSADEDWFHAVEELRSRSFGH